MQNVVMFVCSGVDCSVNTDDCAADPCIHGSCIDLINDYRCICDLPYTGMNCTTLLDPCSPNKCRNAAQCIPDVSYTAFTCRCPNGFTGNFNSPNYSKQQHCLTIPPLAFRVCFFLALEIVVSTSDIRVLLNISF